MNPHQLALARAMRKHSMLPFQATRGGGGGHFDRPDMPLNPDYVHTRKIAMGDINRVLYHS